MSLSKTSTERPLMQPGVGPLPGDIYLQSKVSTVQWGFLPSRVTPPVAEIGSGMAVTVDTVSHEGILEDQGRDPVAFFGTYGIPSAEVLDDAIAIARSGIPHRYEEGPHVVTGPIEVDGVSRGDILQVDVLDLAMRAPYGVVSARHGYGCLAGEYPKTAPPSPAASVSSPSLFGSVFQFVRVSTGPLGAVGRMRYGDMNREAHFALRPFLGVMGVAPDTDDPVPSVPPGNHGGNIDVGLLQVGSTLYLSAQVDGAMFYVGDPHYAQGDGEVALTALEAPLRATLRLTRLDAVQARERLGNIAGPFVETPDYWVPIGLDPDLNEAMRNATRAAITFLVEAIGMRPHEALAYLSAAADFRVSQVVDGTKGIHCCIRKADFSPDVVWPESNEPRGHRE